ncbi:baseplate assembly protein [Veronia nyctiphanis]|uniref:Baseplate assembly protein n=1 Tax=Veronia nyctiphanis TaxID=1278244 RepID=A0A4Q0YA53_9GAMM|nr:baseplate J/gp47 family protein [Veronia nyctiphanis]RXJ66374.1 baseplate assembly protein [Veronia nyctiphanis]
MTSAINLSKLTAPDVVEPLDYETILGEMLADLRKRLPSFSSTVESDPAYKILEVAAYRELLLRQRVNEAARSVMLAFSSKHDLDQLAALFNVERREGESDVSLRMRLPLSLEGLSTAGPRGAYHYHALSASSDVKDVSVVSPKPGEVAVTVLSHHGRGEASPSVLSTVSQALNAEEVRPLTDKVTVRGANVIAYKVVATLICFADPDRNVVTKAARQAAEEYVADTHQLGRAVTRSGLIAALHQPGVMNVKLTSPATDITTASHEAAWCTEITLAVSDG